MAGGVPRSGVAAVVAVVVCVGVVGCSRSGGSASSASAGRAMSAEAIEADLRAQAAAAGITVPDDLRPSPEQLEAMADEKVERFELERQVQAFQECLRAAGFEVVDHGWDEKRNQPDFGTIKTSDGPTAFGATPFSDPAYLRCYGEHFALVNTAWARQNLPSIEKVREEMRGMLQCAAEAGVERPTYGELSPIVVEALMQVEMGQRGSLDDETAEALVACHKRYEIVIANREEADRLFAERLR